MYGIRLDDYWAGIERPGHIAILLEHLPRGSAVHEYYGGPVAITDETDMLGLIEQAIYRTNAEKPESVQRRAYPEGIREKELAAQYDEHQAARFRALAPATTPG